LKRIQLPEYAAQPCKNASRGGAERAYTVLATLLNSFFKYDILGGYMSLKEFFCL
jgi:hypothetical protein